ncbi:MAG: hypothetical protein K2H68_05585, partial [Bacteroidales bacterium]|nr:hypothetical protein [Bacteroidales bacterium]
MSEFPIDVVIAYVDGDDPVLKAKRYSYSHKGKEFQYEDVASDVRYADDGEIYYCVASILKFAPWVRTIHVLTDNQHPPLLEFADKYFPDRKTEIKFVDHRDACAGGYEQYLPVFNSSSVETMVWRIPGLSEHYVYFNDDVFLINPVTPETFFENGKIVAYVRPYNYKKVVRRRFWKSLFPGHHEVSWEYHMINAVALLGEPEEDFPHLVHSPHTQRKSLFAQYYQEHEDVMIKNLDCRFRSAHQYNPQMLNYMLAKKQGLFVEKNPAAFMVSACPKPWRSKSYFDKKIALLDQKPQAVF